MRSRYSKKLMLKELPYKIIGELKDYRNFGSLGRIIEKAEKQLSALGPLIRQNQQALETLTNLRWADFSQKDIKELVALVSIWNKAGNGISSSRKLDTELIDVGTYGNNRNKTTRQSGSW